MGAPQVLLICVALVVVFTNAAPTLAGGPPVNWRKIDRALKAAMNAQPSRLYPVIIEFGHASDKKPTHGTTRALPGNVNLNAGGKGLVDAYAAVTSDLNGNDNRGVRPSDISRVNVYSMIRGNRPLGWKGPNYMGVNWTNLTWDNLIWDNLTWNNLTWDNLPGTRLVAGTRPSQQPGGIQPLIWTSS